MRPPPRLALWLPMAVATAFAALALGLAAGSSGWGWADAQIVWQIRAPRVLAGFGAGAALALAGALMQLLTRNALADPYVLGVSGGASVGALLALLLAPLAWSFWAPALGAALGALLATALLFALAWRALGRANALASAGEGSVSLLLIGVMLGAAASALISLLLTLAPDLQLRGMVFWLLGDLNGATEWRPVWLALALGLALVWPRAHELDLLARGEAWAASLGVPVALRRRLALLAAALMTGAAVATTGAVGFVGLVMPHLMRLAGLRAAAVLLPASALAGGIFLCLADTAARTIVAPLQLPVGVLSAAVGVPVFLALLLHRGSGR
ncbi:MAG TPA: iron ABC transporter permease [Methylibium sp.]